jgi:Archaea bacterial proteins of unknown function
LPGRSGGGGHGRAQKLIHDHAATVFEDHCRAMFPGSGRYWEGDLELDLVAPDPDGAGGVLVAEVKWRFLSPAAQKTLLAQLRDKWACSALSARHPKVRFEVLDAGALKARV